MDVYKLNKAKLTHCDEGTSRMMDIFNSWVWQKLGACCVTTRISLKSWIWNVTSHSALRGSTVTNPIVFSRSKHALILCPVVPVLLDVGRKYTKSRHEAYYMPLRLFQFVYSYSNRINRTFLRFYELKFLNSQSVSSRPLQPRKRGWYRAYASSAGLCGLM